MKTHLWLMFACLIAFIACPAQAGDAKAVHIAFAQFSKVLIAGDGPKVVEALDRASLAYYARVRDLSLNAKAAEVKALSLIDELMVLRLRHDVGFEGLSKVDGHGLVVMAVEKGWINRASIQTIVLGEVTIEKDKAEAVAMTGDALTSLRLHFSREDGKWKFNIVHLTKVGEKGLKELLNKTGQPRHAFLLSIIEQVSGRAPAENIFDPLGTSAPEPPKKPKKPKKQPENQLPRKKTKP
jgi:hypothetical protein